MKGSNDMAEGFVILAIIVIILIVTWTGTPNSQTTAPSVTGDTELSSSSSGADYAAASAPSTQYVYLGTGNASYAYQPYEEYITINNGGDNPINITGWRLKNDKDQRAYDIGGSLRYFPADIAVIGQAAPFVSPSGRNLSQNVILKAGETAVITTGSVGSQSPYRIVSFKENKCSGFLEDLPEYAFTPPLTRNCPRPADEPGVTALDTECRRFIEGMSPCRTPAFDTRDAEGDICHDCADGKLLSSSCVVFIKSHFNYNSCIANHVDDPDFSGQTWRIFLGMGWEMWAEAYETIELFDQLGRSINRQTY